VPSAQRNALSTCRARTNTEKRGSADDGVGDRKIIGEAMAFAAKDYTRIDPNRMHDVRTNSSKLSVLYTVEVECARLIGAWIPRISEIPVKLALARMMFEDAEHASWLEQRLGELRVADQKIKTFRSRSAPALLLLDSVTDPDDFLAGLFRAVKPALLADYKRHLDAAPPYVDDPSMRFIARIMEDLNLQLAKGLSLLAERHVHWSKTANTEAQLRAGLWNLDHEDELSKVSFVGQDPIQQSRPVWPSQVEQLHATDPMPPYPKTRDGGMRRLIHDLVFSELEAVEIFARYVYEFHWCPWQFHFEAARICWDEARHVELLLNVLERYDGLVGQFPAKAPGFEEFMSLSDPVERIIMVSVIAEGEVSTDTQTQHRNAFREIGDELSALLKDYEMADEINHGRFGRRWAQSLAASLHVDYAQAFIRAHRALENFKSRHPEAEDHSQIPLIRLGPDEASEKRTVNATAKRLLGYSEEEILRLVIESGGTLVEEEEG
jgi:uncharacterized ferritin-like protein (DUF455 family)